MGSAQHAGRWPDNEVAIDKMIRTCLVCTVLRVRRTLLYCDQPGSGEMSALRWIPARIWAAVRTRVGVIDMS